MRLKTGLLYAILVLPLPALAQATDYTYTGKDFTSVDRTFSSTDKVTGTFVVSSPLGDDLSYASLTPTTFSFSDGVNTLNNTDSVATIFDVSTSNSGQITEWDISIVGLSDTITTADNGSSIVDADIGTSGTTFAYNTGTPGTWKSTSVPEYSSPLYVIFSAAVIGIGFLARRGRVPSLHQTAC